MNTATSPADSGTGPGPESPGGGAFRLILVALDFGGRPGPEVSRTLRLAHRLGAPITLCHVVLRPTSSAGDSTDGSPADAEETAVVRGLRAAAVTALGAEGHELPIRILHGDPGQRICEYAEFCGADLIVLGPRRPGSLARTLRGSVSKYVVNGTRRSVLVVGD